jgi:hypothetical protein
MVTARQPLRAKMSRCLVVVIAASSYSWQPLATSTHMTSVTRKVIFKKDQDASWSGPDHRSLAIDSRRSAVLPPATSSTSPLVAG